MELTKAEREQIQAQRAATAARESEIAWARQCMLDLTDRQAVQIATQMHAEYKRVNGPQPRCTCDQQWTNPNCPAIKAGWTGMNCDKRPAPIAYLMVKL
jgi:hypothetical protein